jgi:hypothetical protein
MSEAWLLCEGNTKDVHEDPLGVYGDRAEAVDALEDELPEDVEYGDDLSGDLKVFYDVPRFEGQSEPRHQWYVEITAVPDHRGGREDGTTLTLTGLEDVEVEAVLGGISTYQMQALAARAIPKVAAAGNTLAKLAGENPEPVRRTFLENQEVFCVAQMPDEILDHLDLEERDGTLYRPDEDDNWTEVEIDG